MVLSFPPCVKVLAISGSLNRASANSAMLRAAAAAPGGASILLWEDLAQLPYFSPDVAPDRHVASLRTAIADADAVWIATPEYAGGMPGALKNALDWLVGSGELYGKPVVIASAAPHPERGQNARRWVEDVARTQGATVVDSFTVVIRPNDTPERIAAVAEQARRQALEALAASAVSRRQAAC